MADIKSLTALMSAFSNGGTHVLYPNEDGGSNGVYTIASQPDTPATNLTMISSGTGDVIIDLVNAYYILLHNWTALKTFTFTGSAAGRIIFTRGSNDCVKILLFSTPIYDIVANFTYCDFRYSNAGNGLHIAGNAGAFYNMTVVCNNCRVYNNKIDGFSINSAEDATLAKISSLILNNCDSYNNGTVYIDGSEGDGATCHCANHILIINGGNYYSNGKSGVAAIGGSKLVAYNGVNFYNNGALVAGTGSQIAHFGSSTIRGMCLLDNVNVWIDTGQTAALLFFTSYGHYVVRNCVFDFANCLDSGNYVSFRIEDEVQLSLLNNIFKNCRASNNVMIDAPIKTVGMIANNVFCNNRKDFKLRSRLVSFVNNIFLKTAGDSYVFDCVSNEYTNNPLNGYNCFYGLANEAAYFNNNSAGKKTTDIVDDPLLVNASGNDFRLLPGSPCLNTGKAILSNGLSSIGAWQQKQGVFRGIKC